MKYRVSMDFYGVTFLWPEGAVVPPVGGGVHYNIRDATEDENAIMNARIQYGPPLRIRPYVMDADFYSTVPNFPPAVPVEAEDASDEEIALNYSEIILDMQDRIARLERMVEDTAQPAPLFLRLTLVHDKSSVWISVRNIAAMQARSLGTCLVMIGANEDMADGWIAGPSAYRVTETIEEIEAKLGAGAVR